MASQGNILYKIEDRQVRNTPGSKSWHSRANFKMHYLTMGNSCHSRGDPLRSHKQFLRLLSILGLHFHVDGFGWQQQNLE
ncbi:hypothetical protein RvY_11552 [Ramazzottius varieornatus]|uniref:Uncharacterized protein n=1 Tax=Ramazzottius varieornatus TaxID=947166 RepID=A0A1D1VGK0_RAMVA|nr:hypothetical protein RvY_11552 [Ramazzottius varieornatus]